MERKKQELMETLKVKDGFKGMANAEIVSLEDIDTKHGRKTVMSVKDAEGKEHQLFVNVTSMNNLIDAFGGDDTKWPGNIIKLDVEKNEHFDTDMIVVSGLTQDVKENKLDKLTAEAPK